MTDTFRRPRDDEDQSVEDTINEFLANEDVEGLAAWLEANYSSLSPHNQALARDAIIAGQGAGVLDMTPVEDVIGDIPTAPGEVLTETAAEVHEGAVATETYKSWVDRTRNSLVTDYDAQGRITFTHDHLVQLAIEDGMSPADAQNAAQDALDAANEEIAGRDAEDLDEGQRPAPPEGQDAITALDALAPDWVLQMATGLNAGQMMTPGQEQQILAYWNFYNGPSDDIETFADLIPHLEEPSAHNQELVEAALLGDTVNRAITVSLPGGREMSIDEAVGQDLMENYGFNFPGLIRAARLSNLDGAAMPGSDPMTNLLISAALMSATGLTDELGAADPDAEARLAAGEAERQRLAGDIARGFAEPAAGISEEDQRAGDVARGFAEPEAFEEKRFGPRGDDIWAVSWANRRFRAGFERYQDNGMALLHAVDPGLAERVHAADGDPDKLTATDHNAAWSIMRRVSGDSPTIADFIKQGSVLDLFGRLGGAGGGGGGAGPQRRVIDPVGFADNFRQTIEALLLFTPSEEMTNAALAKAQAELDAAEPGMNFDVAARIMAFARGQPVYAELYGGKPAGMTEEEWQGQFQGAQQELTGGETVVEGAVESGMRTGQYQTTVGRVAGEQSIWQDNSTFLGRMARLARVANENL